MQLDIQCTEYKPICFKPLNLDLKYRPFIGITFLFRYGCLISGHFFTDLLFSEGAMYTLAPTSLKVFAIPSLIDALSFDMPKTRQTFLAKSIFVFSGDT